MRTSTAGDRTSPRARRGASVAVAMGVMNVATYGFTMLAARVLGPSDYSAVAAFLATLMVCGVVQLGIQATAARRMAMVAIADMASSLRSTGSSVTCSTVRSARSSA